MHLVSFAAFFGESLATRPALLLTTRANVGGAMGPQLDHGTIVGDEFARIDGAQ
jgi:hypothetical protein